MTKTLDRRLDAAPDAAVLHAVLSNSTGQVCHRPVNDQDGRFIWLPRHVGLPKPHGLAPREFYRIRLRHGNHKVYGHPNRTTLLHLQALFTSKVAQTTAPL